MRRLVAVEGPDDVDTVWERYAVVARWSSWAPPIRSVESSSERLVAGMTGAVHGPPGIRVGFVVDAVDEVAHTWRWQVRMGLLRMSLEHAVVATNSGGSAAMLVVEGPTAPVLLYPPIAQIALGRLVGR